MQKIHAQQDGVATGHANSYDFANAHSHSPGPAAYTIEETTEIPPSSETGDQNTGIRSQRELEELRVALEERIACLESRLQEANEQYQHAVEVNDRQQHEILRLKAELYDLLTSEDPES